MQETPALPENLYLLEGKNRLYLMGQRKHTHAGGYKLVLLLLLVGLVGMFYLVVRLAPEAYTEVMLRFSSAVTEGTYEAGRVDEDNYYLRYSYTVEDTVYERIVRVTGATYENMVIGAPTTVYYVPENPQLSRIDGQTWTLFTFLFITFMLLTSPTTALMIIREARDTRQLEREGQVIFGEITNAQIIRATPEALSAKFKLNYRFLAPDTAQLIEGEKTLGGYSPKSNTPEIGRPVAILYRNSSHYLVL